MAYLEYEITETGCFNVTSHMKDTPEVSENGKKNYPVLRSKGKLVKANKMIYEECFGEIPEGCLLWLRCSNAKCINPEHIEVVSRSEAATRMVYQRDKPPIRKFTEGEGRVVKLYASKNPDLIYLAEMFETTPIIIKKILET